MPLFRPSGSSSILRCWFRTTDATGHRIEAQLKNVDEYLRFRGNLYGQRIRAERNQHWSTTTAREVALAQSQSYATEHPFSVEVMRASESTTTPVATGYEQNNVQLSSTHRTTFEETCAADSSHEVWSELGFDPVIQDLLIRMIDGSNCTKFQSRVLPSLLNGGSSDVLACGSKGCGKSVALVVAMLQGIRNEDAGLNLFLCANSFDVQRVYNMVRVLLEPVNGNLHYVSSSKMTHAPKMRLDWVMHCAYLEDTVSLARRLSACRRRGLKPRMIIITPDILNDLIFKHFDLVSMGELGTLRRVYVDDVACQIPLPAENATVREIQEYDTNPSALQICLAHLHQKLSAPSRSACQFVLFSDKLETRLVQHLNALCMNPYATERFLAVTQLSSTLRTGFCYTRRRAPHELVVYLAWLLQVPGRAIIFVNHDEDMILRRNQLRQLGMDVKVLQDIQNEGMSFTAHWKFLLIRDSEMFSSGGVPDIFSSVTHVFLLSVPQNRYHLLHLLGCVSRLARFVWAICIWPAAQAVQTSETARELGIDVQKYLIHEECVEDMIFGSKSGTFVDSVANAPMGGGNGSGNGGGNGSKIAGIHTDPPEPWGLDPRRVVYAKYEEEDNPESRLMKRLKWRGKSTIYMEEDYTPSWKRRRTRAEAERLIRHLRQRPEDYSNMYIDGYVRTDLRPTGKMKKVLHMDHTDRNIDTKEGDELMAEYGSVLP